MRNKIIYLDNNATTPCTQKVRDAIDLCMTEQWGNASSQHYIGRQAHHLLESSREKVALRLGCHKAEVFFNSGATEGNNWIFLSLLKSKPARRRIVVSSIEHKSVLLSAKSLESQGFEVVELPVTQAGEVNLSYAEELISTDTILVSCQYANNETGVIQPVKELCSLAHKVGALFHCDAVQGLGKDRIDLSDLKVDAATFSAHKIHGPQGVGALFLRGGAKGWPHSFPLMGGGQEQEIRPGTQNLPGIVGFGAAIEDAVDQLQQRISHFRELQCLLENELCRQLPGCVIHGSAAKRIPNTTNVAIPGIPADILMANLPLFCISSGAACNSGSIGFSYVLQKMHVSPEVAECSIRISTSNNTAATDIQCFIEELNRLFSSWRG